MVIFLYRTRKTIWMRQPLGRRGQTLTGTLMACLLRPASCWELWSSVLSVKMFDVISPSPQDNTSQTVV